MNLKSGAKASSLLNISASKKLEAQKFCDFILPKVSRTFAVCIKMLPGKLGKAVLVAYLIARIADTVEDDPHIPAQHKAHLLDELLECFENPEAAARFNSRSRELQNNVHYLNLVSKTDLVFALMRDFSEQTRLSIRHWIGEMIVGMKKFVMTYPTGIRIQTIEEYKEYCYYVAGTVGHLLTDLWYEHSRFVSKEKYELLKAKSATFGEALQTLNILKDVSCDALEENSIYIPEEHLRQCGSSHENLMNEAFFQANVTALTSLKNLAKKDLQEALSYFFELPGLAIPLRLFCLMPLLFGFATLREIENSNAMLTPGGNVKISRKEVKALLLVGPLTACSNFAVKKLVDRILKQPFVLA